MRNKIFLFGAAILILTAIVIRFGWMDKWEKPSACACKEVFATDSSVAVPAARAMVGNAYYEHTLRIARIHCLKAFSADLPTAAWQDTLNGNGATSLAFFNSRCR